MHRGASSLGTDPRDRVIAGICALLVHALLSALLFHQASIGRGNDKGRGQNHGDSLIVYPTMLTSSASRVRSSTSASKRITAEPSNSEPGNQAENQILPSSNPDASHPVSQAGLNPGVNASERYLVQHPAVRMLASNAAPPSSGSEGENSLLAIYHAAMRAAILKTWHGLSNHAYPTGCTIHLSQSPGGTVTATSAAACTLGREEQLQLEAAALMAQPMPYAGFESVFSTELDLTL